MFIQPCFIRKNTPELRKKLEELGVVYDGYYGQNNDFIVVGYGPYNNKYDTVNTLPSNVSYHTYDGYKTFVYMDCGDNEELFLALAALRDDSDYMQWFVTPKTHTKRMSGCFGQAIGMDGHYKEIVGYEWHRHENNDNALTERINSMIQMEVEDVDFLPHKATVEEIFQHFSK